MLGTHRQSFASVCEEGKRFSFTFRLDLDLKTEERDSHLPCARADVDVCSRHHLERCKTSTKTSKYPRGARSWLSPRYRSMNCATSVEPFLGVIQDSFTYKIQVKLYNQFYRQFSSNLGREILCRTFDKQTVQWSESNWNKPTSIFK